MIPKMEFTIRVLINLLVITVSFGAAAVEKNNKLGYVRMKRQDGYVYKRPSVAFELPMRLPVSTKAPTVDRTQAQQMYYAYPAPAGDRGTVNIGFSTSGSSSSTASGGYSSGGYGSGLSTQATGGYDVSTSGGDGSSSTLQSSSGVGYNYGSPTIGTQSTTARTVSTTVSTGTAGPQAAGYNYGMPSITAVTADVNQAGSTVASTNAPKYLPPLGIGGNTGNTVGGGPAVGVSTNLASTDSTSAQGSSEATPSDSYLPPVSMQSGSNTSLGSPSTAYLPPNSSSTSSSYGTPSRPGSPPSTPQTPIASYLPPVASQGPTQGTVSTPAVTYLPPVLK